MHHSARIQLEMAPPHLPLVLTVHRRTADAPTSSVRVLRFGSHLLLVWKKLLMNALMKKAFSDKASQTE